MRKTPRYTQLALQESIGVTTTIIPAYDTHASGHDDSNAFRSVIHEGDAPTFSS